MRDQSSDKSFRLSSAAHVVHAFIKFLEENKMRPASKGSKWVDVGCGKGVFAIPFASLGYIGTMVDPSSIAINYLRTNLPDATYILGGVEKLKDYDYQIATFFLSLHHIKNTDAAIREIGAHLSNYGCLAICELDKEDGSFHSSITVPHNGFDLDCLLQTIYEQTNWKLIAAKRDLSYFTRGGKHYSVWGVIMQKCEGTICRNNDNVRKLFTIRDMDNAGIPISCARKV